MLQMTLIDDAHPNWLELFSQEMEGIRDSLKHLSLGSAHLETGIITLECDYTDSVVARRVSALHVWTFVTIKKSTPPEKDQLSAMRAYRFLRSSKTEFHAHEDGRDVGEQFKTPRDAQLHLLTHLETGLASLAVQVRQKRAEILSIKSRLVSSSSAKRY